MARSERHGSRRRALEPLPAQLDLDGRPHDIEPQNERLRLFEPAPAQLPGQTYIDTEREGTDHGHE